MTRKHQGLPGGRSAIGWFLLAFVCIVAVFAAIADYTTPDTQAASPTPSNGSEPAPPLITEEDELPKDVDWMFPDVDDPGFATSRANDRLKSRGHNQDSTLAEASPLAGKPPAGLGPLRLGATAASIAAKAGTSLQPMPARRYIDERLRAFVRRHIVQLELTLDVEDTNRLLSKDWGQLAFAQEFAYVTPQSWARAKTQLAGNEAACEFAFEQDVSVFIECNIDVPKAAFASFRSTLLAGLEKYGKPTTYDDEMGDGFLWRDEEQFLRVISTGSRFLISCGFNRVWDTWQRERKLTVDSSIEALQARVDRYEADKRARIEAATKRAAALADAL